MMETDIFAPQRGAALAVVRFTRAQVEDGWASESDLANDPLCEHDPICDCWCRWTLDDLTARAAAMDALPAQLRAAEVALAVATLDVEPQLPERCALAPPLPLAPDGRAYDAVISRDAGIGGPFHATSSSAIGAWKRSVLTYIAEHPGDTVWWRKPPTVHGVIRFGETSPVWAVGCKLRIGNAADAEAFRSAMARVIHLVEAHL